MAIGITQSPFTKDNLYQGRRDTIEKQSTYGCCVKTLPRVTGYTSYFAIHW